MSAKIGRNDPCHCGSGKKYKHCHLRLDEQSRPVMQEPPESQKGAMHPGPEELRGVVEMLRETVRANPWDSKSRKLLAELEPILPYLEKAGEIDAAVEELEKHRDEYEALVRNEHTYVECCRELFQEEMFAPLRYTAAEVKEALKAVGGRPEKMRDNEFEQKIRGAMLHLADEKRRRRLAVGLSILLPNLVAQGRYRDAWVVHTCSEMTGEDTKESNPFLFRMFLLGYEALMEEEDAKKATLLQELGIGPEDLNALSFDQLDALLSKQLADPARRARLESLLAASPEDWTEALEVMEIAERRFLELIESDEGASLRLREEELEPVLPAVLERLEKWVTKHPDVLARHDKASTQQVLEKAFWPALDHMARTIFTPKRITEFELQLLEVRQQRLDSNDVATASSVHTVLRSLRKVDEPAKNMYLVRLCNYSLRQAIAKLGQANEEPRQAGEGPREKTV